MAGGQTFTKSKFSEDTAALRRKCLNYMGDPRFLNYFSQFLLIFGLSGIFITGELVTIPFIYRDHDVLTCRLVQGVGWFMAIQMVVNLVCMRLVSSAYSPMIHGAIPDGVKIGQIVNSPIVREDYDRHSTTENGKTGRVRKDANLFKMNNHSVMYVATELPKSVNEGPKRTAFPYFSWTICILCNRPRPPRCHHCVLCNTCVLKRDHHCFFAGTCVGYNNLRHFTVFLFWAAVSTLFSDFHAFPWAYHEILPHVTYFDMFFPIAIVRGLLGFIKAKFAIVIVLLWVLAFFTWWSISFLMEAYAWVSSGKTSFEIDHKMNIHDTRDMSSKLLAVFGNYWVLNFLVPLHFVFKPVDNPALWPSIRG